ANPPGLDLALTDEEEAAYVRTADRLNRMWALGSGVDRYLY
ncbi:MAG: LuxR family transcriptional regulator, partial [Arsenicicoccus sp.]